MRLSIIASLTVLIASSAHAEILSVSCYSQFASGFSQQTNGNVFPVPKTNKQEAISRAMINARNRKCIDGTLPVCPTGTIDLGVTSVTSCTSVVFENGNAEWGFHNSTTCDDPYLSQVNGGQSMGVCEKLSCQLIKSCVVPGA